MAVKKIYYSMGEVAEMFDVSQALVRHWESQFDCIKPHRNKKGNRMFTEADIEKLKQIYHLVKERGMTLEGANKVMRASAKTADLSRDTEMLERLQRIRAALVEVREELKLGVGEQIVSSEVEDSPVEVEFNATVEPVAEPINEPKVEPVTELAAEPATEPQAATEAEQDSEPKSEQPKKRVVRRKKKSDDDNKELFPFYEQSLF